MIIFISVMLIAALVAIVVITASATSGRNRPEDREDTVPSAEVGSEGMRVVDAGEITVGDPEAVEEE